MDKAPKNRDVKVAPSPVNGSVPAPEAAGSVSDDSKGRKNVTADDKQAETTVRVHPGSSPQPTSPPSASPRSAQAPATEQNRAPWSPGSLSSPQPSPDASGDKKGSGPAPRSPRKAHLVLRRIEPWSAMKFSFVVALVCFVVLFVAVAALYMVLSSLGVFDNIIQTVNQLTMADGKPTSDIDIASWFEPVRILGYTALIGAVNVVLITALATLGAVIYNISSDLVGGIEVTFSEAE